MRIARIGTMRQPYPPTDYGGTQRSMAQMTVFQAAICGHDVVLYAPADSTIIDFAATISKQLGLDSKLNASGQSIEIFKSDGTSGSVWLRSTGCCSTGYDDPHEEARNLELVGLLLEDDKQQPYDIIHNHYKNHVIDSLIPAGLGHKVLTHNHSNAVANQYARYRYPIICISHSQARYLKEEFDANVFDVIHHGLDAGIYRPTKSHAGYLAWIGHFTKKKGAATAIRIARKANLPLVLAGTLRNLDQENRRYFKRHVEPSINLVDYTFLDRIRGLSPTLVKQEISSIATAAECAAPVIFSGPANEAQKQALYGNAMATLFPVHWSEPFGRVMIESMACGTPVVGNIRVGAIDCGAVKEVVQHGVTGYHVNAADEDDQVNLAVDAVNKASELDRLQVRKIFERDWSSERVAIQLDSTFHRFLAEPKTPISGS